MIYTYTLDIGVVTIRQEDDAIVEVKLNDPHAPKCVFPDYHGLIHETYIQIQEYLNGERKVFSINIKPKGSPFCLSVWKALSDIPFGRTVSYQHIAQTIGNPKAARAVGLACSKNPIHIIIPCHRVIAKNSKLGGYAGGVQVKETLLQHETNFERRI